MGQTFAEQILSHSAGYNVKAGELIVVEPDLIMAHDSLTPSIIRIMREELGIEHVHNPERAVIVIDHVAPASTLSIANSQNLIRQFASEEGIRLFDAGRGICHQVLIEERLAQPGYVIIGSDSHSTSYGAVAAFGTGMGSTDVALCLATGRIWLRVPESIKINVIGRFQPGVTAKDLALKIGRELTISGANYCSVEYHGLQWLDLPSRQTISSMAVEIGAKAGIFPPSPTIKEFFHIPDWLKNDPEAEFVRELTIDLNALSPQIALPHAVDKVVDIDKVAGTKVDVVFLGTCTNGRYEDMKAAANILKGYRISSTVRMLLTPASSRELQKASLDGTLSTLIDAGVTLITPGCGPCMGRHNGTLADGDVCLSTGNRNFRGRMGSPNSSIYLASPEVAAASAITGVITAPKEI
ncbi:MAG: 3-isopropylmalate dehydratase large subunit [Blastocatellia bacterium]|nr:3-isopropylmalate dehydratase large subunit [Blastocatellia bacterium]